MWAWICYFRFVVLLVVGYSGFVYLVGYLDCLVEGWYNTVSGACVFLAACAFWVLFYVGAIGVLLWVDCVSIFCSLWSLGFGCTAVVFVILVLVLSLGCIWACLLALKFGFVWFSFCSIVFGYFVFVDLIT